MTRMIEATMAAGSFAADAAPALTPPPGFWQREASHYPRPLSPLFASSALPAYNAGLRHVFAEFSLLVETLELRPIGGRVYTRLVPLGGKERAAPPDWLFALVVRLAPPLRKRVRGCVAAVRADLQGALIERWYAEWKPDLIARAAALRAVALPTLSDDAMLAHLNAVMALMDLGGEVHFRLHGALCLILGELAFACRDLLGWDDQRTFALLAGLSGASTEPARRLAALAGMARERPAVSAALAAPEACDAERLADADPAFARAFAAYQEEFGHRALRYEVLDPALAETPALALGLLADQLAHGYDPAADTAALTERRATAVAAARAALNRRTPAAQQRFERALTRAERAYPVREENEFYTISAPLAYLRYAALEIGRRLAARGDLASAEDAFFLDLAELRLALGAPADRRALVAQRREERARAEARPAPASYGKDPGPPPSFAALPAEARFAMEAMTWVLDRVMPAEAALGAKSTAATLRGIAAAPGQYTGPARVILGEDEFDKIEPGDVLVCPITSPVWSVLFPSTGALVTDTGGVLSHPAIIAREYRIPAVVATGDATRRLRDGQRVTVDGDTGLVSVQDG